MLSANNYLTVPQAAKICSVDRTTMHRWVTSGKIKSHSTPGGHKRIQPMDLRNFFKENDIPIELDDFFEDRIVKILIIDDDPHVRNYLKTLLSGPFVDIKTASDGFDAGVKLVSFNPRLIILDLSMPHMDGFEVCRHIKENPDTKNIKILVMSGHGTKKNIDKVMSLGADAFLCKPSPKKTILKCVETLLENKKYAPPALKTASETNLDWADK